MAGTGRGLTYICFQGLKKIMRTPTEENNENAQVGAAVFRPATMLGSYRYTKSSNILVLNLTEAGPYPILQREASIHNYVQLKNVYLPIFFIFC